MGRIGRFSDEEFTVDFLGKVSELRLARSNITGCEIRPLKDSKSRGVVLFTLSVRGTGSPPTSHVPIVAKLRRSTVDKGTFATMRQLWQNGFGRGSHLQVSQPIAYVEDWRVLLTYYSTGVTLDQLLAAGHESFAACVGQAAEWLVRLHQTVIPAPKVRSVQDEVKKLEKTNARFKEKYPSLLPRARQVGDEIARRVKSVSVNSFRLTHGDFLPKNILSNGTDLTVIDLGRICLFDPAKDVGKFIGHTTVKVWSYGVSFDAEALRERFLRAYAPEYSAKFLSRIAAYEARAYLRRSLQVRDHDTAVYWLQKAEQRLQHPGLQANNEGEARAPVISATIPKS